MEIKALAGQTLSAVVGEVEGETLDMVLMDGNVIRFYHMQDCCEHVFVEDICGDLQDLVGSPLLMADVEESSSDVSGNGTETWTFYKFATIKGSVTVRWCGESNGYYSERVDMAMLDSDGRVVARDCCGDCDLVPVFLSMGMFR